MATLKDLLFKRMPEKISEKIWDLNNPEFKKVRLSVSLDNKDGYVKFVFKIQRSDGRLSFVRFPEEIRIKQFIQMGVRFKVDNPYKILEMPSDNIDNIKSFYCYLINELDKYINNLFLQNDLKQIEIKKLKENLSCF